MSDAKPCEYCGTPVNNGGYAVVSGEYHYAATCREYAVGGLRATIRDLAARLEAAEKVVSAARWVTVSALDCDTDVEVLAAVRPTAAEELLRALESYDAAFVARGERKKP